MATALITGATGLVGSHIAVRLLRDGWTVRALVRDVSRSAPLLPDGVEPHVGDVLDGESFTRAARGCDVVFHAAANIIVPGGWDAYRVTNIEGTRHAIAAAERAGARLLHVSSVAVYGGGGRYDAVRRGGRTDESTPLAPLPERAFYARSKRESEALVLAAHEAGRVWATAIRPDVIYGRRDRQFVPRMARLIQHGVIPLLRGGRTIIPVVHAENVAQGAVLAAANAQAGGRTYNLANDFDVSVRRFFELAGDGLGRRTRWLPLPLWLARAAFRGARSIVRVASGGRFRMAGSASIEFLSEDNPFSSDRARRELGWQPEIHPEVGVPDAFRWWLERERARR